MPLFSAWLSSVDPLDRVLVLPRVGPALTLAGFLAVPRLLPLPPVRRRLVRELGLLPASSVDDVVRQIRRRDWRAFVVEQRALVREIAGLAARLPEVDTRRRSCSAGGSTSCCCRASWGSSPRPSYVPANRRGCSTRRARLTAPRARMRRRRELVNGLRR